MRRDELRSAVGVPSVSNKTQLAAQLVMSGFRLVPEDLWEALSEKFQRLYPEEINLDGLTEETNHERLGPHEVWQNTDLPEKYEPGTWVIPWNELADLDGEDDVSVTRLMCVGTEEDMRAVVSQLLALPDSDDT